MKVNGNERAVPAEGTVLSLLKELGHDPQRVAVEKNGTIIPRAQFAEEKLTYADHLEVVCFVGTYCVKRGYVPKKFARRERHTHFLLV